MGRSRWRGRVVAVSAACGVLLAGTSVAGAKASDFRRKADGVCIEVSNAITEYENENGIAQTAEDQAASSEALLPARRDGLEALQAITAPKKVRDAYEEFVDLRSQLIDNTQALIEATTSGDTDAQADLREENSDLDDQENQAAADAGLLACAEVLPDRVTDEVAQIVEENWTAGDPDFCTERYTEVYVSSFYGDLETCEAEESNPANVADSITIDHIEGVVKSRVSVDFTAFDARYREVLVYVDGEYKRQAVYSLG